MSAAARPQATGRDIAEIFAETYGIQRKRGARGADRPVIRRPESATDSIGYSRNSRRPAQSASFLRASRKGGWDYRRPSRGKPRETTRGRRASSAGESAGRFSRETRNPPRGHPPLPLKIGRRVKNPESGSHKK